MIALIAGWVLTQSEVMKELDTTHAWFISWRFLVRFVAPTAVAFVFLRIFLRLRAIRFLRLAPCYWSASLRLANDAKNRAISALQ